MKLRWLAALLFVAMSGAAEAHKPSDSYVKILGGGETLSVQWDIALKDLEMLVGIDENKDLEITWGEVKARRDAIVSHALARLEIIGDGTEAKLVVKDLLFTEHSDGGYAVLMLDTGLPGDVARLLVRYQLLFEFDPTHRGLVLYEAADGGANTQILSPDRREVEIVTAETGIWATFVDFVGEGIWHIWIGLDHILFLVCLLLAAVLVRDGKSWRPREGFWPSCRAVLQIVTVFTLAHSITLWLAVMEYVKLPSAFIEATIALSIVIVALNSVFPVLPLSGWAFAFVFGLIHGFGFANVLVDLGLSSSALAISLLGFNIGVELGQLAIVLVVFPLAFFARKSRFYYRFVFIGGSLLNWYYRSYLVCGACF